MTRTRSGEAPQTTRIFVVTLVGKKADTAEMCRDALERVKAHAAQLPQADQVRFQVLEQYDLIFVSGKSIRSCPNATGSAAPAAETPDAPHPSSEPAP